MTALEQATFIDALREALGLAPIEHHYIERLPKGQRRSQADESFTRHALKYMREGNYRVSTAGGRTEL